MTSSDFQIRPVLPAEHDALGELSVRSYLHGDLLIGGLDDPYAPNLRDVAVRAAAATVLVAVDESAVEEGTVKKGTVEERAVEGDSGTNGSGPALLGGVTLAFHGSPMAQLAGPGEAEVRMLAVDPAAQGRGVGSALAAACVERARAEPGTKRVVLCSQQAMTTAHRVYARLGFERAPDLDWYPLPEIRLWGFRLEL
ncbi:GNAT family N-acetyltransferase [Glycomyces algeriensis]|uniref:N-acetyltransferase n=1 Tax=Glycomyces algeriensis TaxID=256037 RepID=A0A9W6G9F8_9ACTN|nr:GNAT family N-acetyltransferase [Glycomyces algeriensis]MDA1364833.1 GNAT family N-acetyltransferase [Glycomyces algeriensis]MDR7350108.1 ribosomal protein S18 acetylase RimI-like enzyme [Glycomyces algeriensis]GLI42821.1 N-acetyltransferase [Glycomyces algeriensis]